MSQFESLLWLTADELENEIKCAKVLVKNLETFSKDGNFSKAQVRKSPAFKRSLYVPSSVYVCMGVPLTKGDIEGDMTHTGPIIVDGRHLGWVLTRGGLYQVGQQCGYHKGIVGGRSMGIALK